MTTKSRVWFTSDDGSIEIVSLTRDSFRGALDLIYEAFYPHENVCIALDLAKNREAMEELDGLIENAAKDGVSLVAIEKSTGAIAGVAFNKLQCKNASQETEAFFDNYAAKCKHASSKEVVKFMADIDARCDLFTLLNVDCILEIMFLATHPNFRGKQISTKLCEASIELTDTLRKGTNVKVALNGGELPLEPVPKAVSAIFTSFITQRIGEKLGFLRGILVSYDELEFQGRKYSSKIDRRTPFTTVEYKRLE